jgi:acetate kinase
MRILVINSGSSSLKYELFIVSGKKIKSLFEGLIDRIGFSSEIKNHHEALKIALKSLLDQKIIKSLQEIDAIGHRVVHGGKINKPCIITPSLKKEIKRLINLAPLHNPANLATIEACENALKDKPHVAIFDTAFHQTMEETAYLYAIPQEYFKKYGIRRYGFHGTSHLYVSKQAVKLLKKKNAKIITCHLGNGCSVTAIKNGKSVDTSMGFTPLEGLPMGTRCGDIDPAVVYKIMEIKKMDHAQIDHLLNKESGLKALSGFSHDMRDIWKKSRNNQRAKLALNYLAYKTAKYIASYTAALGGLDAIVFTAGMGEKAFYLRKLICDKLKHLGVTIDNKRNQHGQTTISKAKSKVKIYIIPTDEEKEIAQQTYEVLKQQIK